MSADLPSKRELLVISRFTFGYTPEQLAQVRAAGGVDRWLARQFKPHRIPDPIEAKMRKAFPAAYFTGHQARTRPAFPDQHQQAGARDVFLDAFSPRQVQAVMYDFWRNLFYTAMGTNHAGAYYVQVQNRRMRDAALTSFPRLLKTAIMSGEMFGYLDALGLWPQSPNENLARELMEVHTVGKGNYRERDVRQLALLLTGFVTRNHTDKIHYHPDVHYRGRIKVLGWSHPNPSRDPRPALKSFLRYLAMHPATIRRVVRRMAQKFVSEDPSKRLLKDMTRSWKKTGGDIAPLIRIMVNSEDFARASVGGKVKMPREETISMVRHIIADPGDRFGEHHAGFKFFWTPGSAGNLPHGWPMPNGHREDNAAWTTLQRLHWSTTIHHTLPRIGADAAPEWPVVARFLTPHEYFPDPTPGAPPIPLATLVDHLHRRFTGTPAPNSVILATAQYTGIDPDTPVAPEALHTGIGTVRTYQFEHMRGKQFWVLLGAVFDSPAFLRR